MAITLAEISKLRTMTGAGMMDCKNALNEANGDFDKAIEIIRKKGQAIAAKRSDRQAAEGCILAGVNGNYAVALALKCETDFVAKNADFIALTQQILDFALANKPADLEALKAGVINGSTIQQLVTDRSGITGEKMELDMFCSVSGESVIAYVHPGNKLASIVAFNLANVDNAVAKDVAMQVAAMSPIAIDPSGVPAEEIEKEREIAAEKTKAEMVQKQVDNALSKAGINPAHVDSEAHIESNMAKGWITEEQAAKAREIKVSAAEQAAANLKPQMLENIVNGRINKLFKEKTLLQQEFIKDAKMNVAQYMDKQCKGLTATAFKRITLNQE
ncbi:MAG: elongation factor Ts [Paludibacteraceae bacterium]|nr:elongation factor Ts [Paludibacteraceae bacterium]MBR4840671.1 elongation factor Ts [Paludibacteraceae bacterium]